MFNQLVDSSSENAPKGEERQIQNQKTNEKERQEPT